jgi:hypothetical protein
VFKTLLYLSGTEIELEYLPREISEDEQIRTVGIEFVADEMRWKKL